MQTAVPRPLSPLHRSMSTFIHHAPLEVFFSVHRPSPPPNLCNRLDAPLPTATRRRTPTPDQQRTTDLRAVEAASTPASLPPPFPQISTLSLLPPSLHPASLSGPQHAAGMVTNILRLTWTSDSCVDSGLLGPHWLTSFPPGGSGPGDLGDMRHFINRYK